MQYLHVSLSRAMKHMVDMFGATDCRLLPVLGFHLFDSLASW
jgi:hypothetical protein